MGRWALAKKLLAQITPDQVAQWKEGTFDDWAMETFNIAFDDAYGNPPLSNIRARCSTSIPHMWTERRRTLRCS
jgi:hypothetical protein